MPTVAFHTLGCKVNQYDTQAMSELFVSEGYTVVPFEGPADVYVLNTCTVTGTGDRKSLQIARRIRRDHPDARLILCGCLAQKKGAQLFSAGADLILGTQRRGEVVSLLRQVVRDGSPVCAVGPLTAGTVFEPLRISRQDEHTRATLKIQEGCNNRCTYCIIPSVRGPIRSREPEDIHTEAIRLRDAGFKEIVLTGIHLASYGKDWPDRRVTLLDAIRTVHCVDGIERIRLGSLEPVVATDTFCRALGDMPKVCPQFHLALQSGSDAVLKRMKRRYNTAQYLKAVEAIRSVFPRAALTTDILTGFPGETEQEYLETSRFIEKIGYARIHVFPYSRRDDTPAAVMPGQLSTAVREQRARELIALGAGMSRAYLETWIGLESEIIPEEIIQGAWEGYTPEYIRVSLPGDQPCVKGNPVRVSLVSLSARGMNGIKSE